MSSTNLPARISRFSDDQLRALEPANVRALLADTGTPSTDIDDILGTGFKVAENKDLLIGRPFLILDWHYTDGDHGVFVSLLAVTQTEKIVINDGGSGILAQIQALESEGYSGSAIRVMRGLRKSEFWYDPNDPKGEKYKSQEDPSYKLGTTYYLAV